MTWMDSVTRSLVGLRERPPVSRLAWILSFLLALGSLGATAQAQTRAAAQSTSSTQLFDDLDDSGRLTCGDLMATLVTLGASNQQDLVEPVLEIPIPDNLTLVSGTLIAGTSDPGPQPVVESGTLSTHRVVRVRWDRIRERDCLFCGALVSFRTRLNNPNSATEVSVSGTLSGANFDPVVVEVLQPVATYPACPPPPNPEPDPTPLPAPSLDALSRVSLVEDLDGDGGVDVGDVIRYRLELANVRPPANGAAFQVTYGVVLDKALALVPGSVTVSRGTVVPGALDVVFSLGTLDPGARVTASYDVRVVGEKAILVHQGRLTANNHPSVLTDDPDTAAVDAPNLTPVDHDPEVGTEKILLPNRAEPGEVLVYDLAAVNFDLVQEATGVVLTETIPVGTTFEAARSEPGWQCEGTTPGSVCTFPVGRLPAAGGPEGLVTRRVAFALRVDPALPAGLLELTNTVAIADDGRNGPDRNLANNQATLRTPVLGAAPDLAVTKSDGGALARPGEVVVYELTVTNQGNQDAAGASLEESLPEHTTFEPGLSTPGWGCADEKEIHCLLHLGAVAVGTTRIVTFALRVAATLPAGLSQLVNHAIVRNPGGDLDTSNNEATEETPFDPAVTGPDLEVTKSDGDALARPGEVLVYQLAWANAGNQGAAGVLLEETVPEHTVFEAASSDPAWSCLAAAGTEALTAGTRCVLSLGEVPAGASGEVDFAVRVAEVLPVGVTVIANTAVVRGESPADLDPDDNQDTEVTPVDPKALGPDLVVTKDDGGAEARPGEVVAYRLEVENRGNQVAPGVFLEEIVPAHTAFARANSTVGWNCPDQAPAGSHCRLELGDLDPVQGRTVTFAVQVAATLPAGVEVLVNRVAAGDGGSVPDRTPEDNQDTEETPVAPGAFVPDVGVAKDDGGARVFPGQVVAYTLTVTNHGNRDATGVKLQEVVPEGSRFEAATSSPGWDCPNGAEAGSTCLLTVGALAAGETAQRTFAVRAVTEPPEGLLKLVNTVRAADDGRGGADPDPGNNTASDETDLEIPDDGPPPVALLEATLTDVLSLDSNQDGLLGLEDALTYVLVVTNTGGEIARGVSVRVPLTHSRPVAQSVATVGTVRTGQNETDDEVDVGLGDLAPGQSSEITWVVQLAPPLIPPGLREIEAQATVSARNVQPRRSDDPDTPAVDDPTRTPLEEGVGGDAIHDIPTVSEWGLILLALGLGGVAVRRVSGAIKTS